MITFLDSHSECTEGWLEPLLDRIGRNNTNVVCPMIDVIDDDTLEWGVNDVGGFDWNLQSVPDHEKHSHPAEPVASPTMAGGLFSIDKAYFDRHGSAPMITDSTSGAERTLSSPTRVGCVAALWRLSPAPTWATSSGKETQLLTLVRTQI